jgi:tetratricopeptide (TPR) repeat protein
MRMRQRVARAFILWLTGAVLWAATAWTQTAEETSSEKVVRLMRAGSEKYGAGDYPGTISLLSEALVIQPDELNALALRGVSYVLLKEYEKAMSDAEHALRVDPKNANALLLRGSIHEECRRFVPAYEDYHQGIVWSYHTAAFYEGRARMRRQGEDYAGAIEDFSRAIERRPPEAAAWKGRAYARMRAKDFDGALADLNKALSFSPNDVGAHGLRATCWRSMGDLEKSVAEFSRMIEIKPRDPELYIERGLTRAIQQRYDLVVADMRKAVELGANGYDVWAMQALGLFRLRRFEESKRACDEALQRKAGDTSALHRRARVHLNLGDFQAALTDYSAVLSAESDTADALSFRSDVWQSMGEYEKAREDADHAIKASSKSLPYDHVARLLLSRRLKRVDAEEGFAEQIPSWTDAWWKTIGEFLAGKIDERELLLRTNDAEPEKAKDRRCEAYYYAGMVRLLEGKREAARALFQRCVQTDVWRYREYVLAKAELARMDVGAK